MNRNCLVSTHSMNHLMDSAGWQALVDQAPSFSPPDYRFRTTSGEWKELEATAHQAPHLTGPTA